VDSGLGRRGRGSWVQSTGRLGLKQDPGPYSGSCGTAAICHEDGIKKQLPGPRPSWLKYVKLQQPFPCLNRFPSGQQEAKPWAGQLLPVIDGVCGSCLAAFAGMLSLSLQSSPSVTSRCFPASISRLYPLHSNALQFPFHLDFIFQPTFGKTLTLRHLAYGHLASQTRHTDLLCTSLLICTSRPILGRGFALCTV
jgi:hypothetical protein